MSFHELSNFSLKLLVYGQVLLSISKTLLSLVLGKKVALNLREGVITNFFKLITQLIILLLQLVDILILEGQLADKIGDLLLLGRKLLMSYLILAFQ